MTVLGIALVSIKKIGQDFINVTINNKVVSLFNYNKHTVMDVILQAGIDPKVLIGRNGKNVKFTLNGTKRVAFGEMSESASIKINSQKASVDSPVKEGDIIELKYAKDGINAEPKVLDYAANYTSIACYFNDKLYNMEPIAVINGQRVNFDTVIEDNDKVEILYPNTLGDLIKYYLEKVSSESKFYVDKKEISYDYIIKEGDKIIEAEVVNTVSPTSSDTVSEEIGEVAQDERAMEAGNENEVAIDTVKVEEKKESKTVTVKVNSEKVILKGKDKYIFVDIFNYIKFDRTSSKGMLVLELNGKQAGYYDELKDGDVIDIRWE